MSVGFQAFYDATAKGAGKAIQVKMTGGAGNDAIQTDNYSA